MSAWNLSPQALRDLLLITEYIASDNPDAADAFVDKLEETLQRLGSYPEMGRAREDLASGLRHLPHGNYNIVYPQSGPDVEIVRIINRHRDIDAMFEEN